MDRLSKTTEYLKRDILCSRQDSTRTPPFYQYTASLQHQPAQVSVFYIQETQDKGSFFPHDLSSNFICSIPNFNIYKQ